MEVLNAMDLKAGKLAKTNRVGTLTQPLQFLPKEEKNEEWTGWNMDWYEWQGLKQLRRNARRLLKNYKLGKGIIDKSDYIVEEDNNYTELIEVLGREDDTALELKFYPIIPNVINVLCNEFSKRSTKISFRTVDEYSYNEMLEKKKEDIERTLVADAQNKMMSKMLEMGMDPNTPEFQQELAPEKLKTLPEIEEFFKKNYRNIPEKWATHQHQVDTERFKMDELEEVGFRDSLIADREFWHFKMMEDDYEVELWNPVLTFYHKSPGARYISQSNYVGMVDMMTVADVIDKYGPYMSQEQRESLEYVYPIRAALYPVTGYQNDGSYYDATRSHQWNVGAPSLGYRQFTSMHNGFVQNGADIVNWILGESEDFLDFGNTGLLRVCTTYWKSQRKVGYLTSIDEQGEAHIAIVDETHKTTTKPVYDLSIFKNKSKDNVVFGEHVDWIWINETWGGVKIGPNKPGFWGTPDTGQISPIYLGIMQNKPGRLKFQFKGDTTLYGCKLPVEGCVFSDRNTRSTSCVDLLKPFQIGYNIVNNQIADILVDELGTVIMLDQNALPKHSMGEDWGKGNYSKAFVAMKSFGILPLDTSISNTENATNFNHFQKLDLEQTNRLMSRINLANYFKTQAMETIGITPQRLGQQIAQTQTATGVEQALNASYAQTEMYFTQHCDHLMPRVQQMRTDLAQYYQSTKPSLRLQYMTSADEKVNFEISGTELLLRDINIFCTTKANHRAIMEQLKQMLIKDNTTGASIYDLGEVMQAESMAELNIVLKATEAKANQMKQEEHDRAGQLQQQALEAEAAAQDKRMMFEATENQKDREEHILEAQIRSAGFGAMQDIDKNNQSDYVDYMDNLRKTEEFQTAIGLKRQAQSAKENQFVQKMDLDRQKLQVQKDLKNKDVEIARTNKNQYDVKQKSKNKK